MKYRSKSVPRVLDEIKYLINRYKIKKLPVVDNIMDLKYIDELFPLLYNERLGIKLFYETKANISKKQLMVMAQGGIVAIQPGIESLSDNILKIMKKGVLALQNIQLLKWCREIGTIPLWNLICGFPTEPEEEYDRMAMHPLRFYDVLWCILACYMALCGTFCQGYDSLRRDLVFYDFYGYYPRFP